MIKPLISLTWKKIWRTGHLGLALLILCFFAFLYLAIFKRSLAVAMETFVIVLPFIGLLLTGGLIKDELDSKNLELILSRSKPREIILSKLLAVLSLIFFFIIIILLTGLIFYLRGPQDLELTEFLSLSGRCLIICFNLIATGLFLSCWFKGQSNFVFLFFLQIGFIIFVEEMDWLKPIANLLDARTFDLKMIPVMLFSPNIIQRSNSLPLILLVVSYGLIFIWLSYLSLKHLGLKKNYLIRAAEEKNGDYCILVNNLSKSYPSGLFKKKKVLREISFSLRRNTITGFLGPNGAGKTTTLRLILGYLKPDGGSIEIISSDHHCPQDLKIGYLSENPSLYPFLTCREILDFILRMSGIKSPQKEKQIKEFLKNFGLNKYADSRIKALSKGNLQKLALALAVVDDPEIIILDEPYTGLDPIVMNDIRQQILKLQQEGKTIFFSSHLLPEVDQICNEVIFINNGRIIASGEISDLKWKWRVFTAIKTDKSLKEQYLQETGLDKSAVNFIHFLQSDSEKISQNKLFNQAATKIPEPTLETIFLEIIRYLDF